MARPRIAHLVLAAGVAMLAVPTAVLLSGATSAQVTPDVGARPTLTATSVPSQPANPSAPDQKSRTANSPVMVIPLPATVAPPRQSPPVKIVLKSIGVRAAVDAVGVDSNESVAIPEDISRVGWYRYGTAPGSKSGSAVIVGHRDGRIDGAGAFYNLGQLGIGDPVVVTNASGVSTTYRVVARQTISKKVLPLSELFSRVGPPRLTLISCGGEYVRSEGGYRDNVVVTAIATSPTAAPGSAS